MSRANAIRVALAVALVSASALPAAPPAGHTDIVYAVAAAPDGKHFVSASEDNTAIVWESEKLAARFVLEHAAPVYDAAFAPGGKEIVTADGAGKVSVWAAGTGKR